MKTNSSKSFGIKHISATLYEEFSILHEYIISLHLSLTSCLASLHIGLHTFRASSLLFVTLALRIKRMCVTVCLCYPKNISVMKND
jgi:ABC-type uncharacterized transport system permease subunit